MGSISTGSEMLLIQKGKPTMRWCSIHARLHRGKVCPKCERKALMDKLYPQFPEPVTMRTLKLRKAAGLW